MNKHLGAFMKTADVWKNESKCLKRQVAAVITNEHFRILSVGYNGTHTQAFECAEYFKVNEDGYFVSNKLVDLIPNFDLDVSTDWIEVGETEFKVLHKRFAEFYETHAEINAILNMLKTCTDIPEEMSIFVTCEPCVNCRKTIVAAGIKHVYFGELYDGTAAKYFEMFGVTCEQLQSE